MIADVPLGALLSGGVDSSVVVSEMAAASSQPVKTFSIGFRQEEFNELPLARLTAERFGTEHEEFMVEPHAIEIVPKLVRHYGEPYADSSAIPSFYLAELTRRHVTVALNGDGGDESFAGYLRYVANSMARGLDHVPRALRRGGAAAAARFLAAGDARGMRSYGRRFLTSMGEDGPGRYAAQVGIFSESERDSLLCEPIPTDARAATEGRDREPHGVKRRGAAGSTSCSRPTSTPICPGICWRRWTSPRWPTGWRRARRCSTPS